MISISATGRLAHQPELKMIPGGGQVCEFRLLDSRFHKGQEVTEAVTFFCYGEMAEEFCSTTVKGQEISATGTQETQNYTPPNGTPRQYVKYRLSWFSRGRKPYTGDRSQGQQGTGAQGPRQLQGNGGGQMPGQRPQQRQQYGQQDRNWQGGERPQEPHNHIPVENFDDRGSGEFRHSGFGPDDDHEPGFLP
jgi:single-stranded DNA-binding protein